MTPKQFAKILKRDLHCYHCGQDIDLVPQHRINRAMGSKNAKAEQLSNIIAFCSLANGDIESRAISATLARDYGWKLSQWQDPEKTPVFDYLTNTWYLLDNAGNRVVHLKEKSGPREADRFSDR